MRGGISSGPPGDGSLTGCGVGPPGIGSVTGYGSGSSGGVVSGTVGPGVVGESGSLGSNGLCGPASYINHMVVENNGQANVHLSACLRFYRIAARTGVDHGQ